MVQLHDIQIRDPFVLPLPQDGTYYLFGSTDKNIWSGPGTGFDCYRSTDLQTWEGPIPAFRPERDFWATTQFWAPEVHSYGGRFYMFATFKAEGAFRGTQILAADRPEGPYRPWSERPVTPANWECLDGTLHVDANGTPWLVFCHEWQQVHDGTICAQQLTPDLRAATGRPVYLFSASEAAWARPLQRRERKDFPVFVTDGPFLHRTAEGVLLMLWSSIGENGYAMGTARSESGDVLGPWTQEKEPLWSQDGGHGMVFRTFEGTPFLTLHQPNDTPNERTVLRALDESAAAIRLAS